ncbi:MAG: DUF2007 domain-containing protein [Desulforhopalus sp.]
MKDTFVKYELILETHNAGDRVFLKSLLDAEKITYFIQGEYLAPYVFNALPMRLMVRKDQADRARELLKDIELSYSYGVSNDQEDGDEEEPFIMTGEQQSTVLDAVHKASKLWKSSFNRGDAAGCADQYEDNAVMHARPFGTFIGTESIQGFWQQLIDDGYADIEYINPVVEVVDATSAVLTAQWKMNKARGVIHRELWVLQPDGSAQLREDDFEAK